MTRREMLTEEGVQKILNKPNELPIDSSCAGCVIFDWENKYGHCHHRCSHECAYKTCEENLNNFLDEQYTEAEIKELRKMITNIRELEVHDFEEDYIREALIYYQKLCHKAGDTKAEKAVGIILERWFGGEVIIP